MFRGATIISVAISDLISGSFSFPFILSDVEIESNGFYTYDRKILKIPANIIQKLNNEIYREFN